MSRYRRHGELEMIEGRERLVQLKLAAEDLGLSLTIWPLYRNSEAKFFGAFIFLPGLVGSNRELY